MNATADLDAPTRTAPTAASARSLPREGAIPIAIAGAGYIAAYHLAALRELGGFEIVGACDPDAARVAALAAQWNIPHTAATLPELLAKCRPAVVHVLVPPAHHVAVARQALEAGVHAFVEKPLALHAADAEQLVALANERGLLLGVNHNAVFHPAFQALRRDIAARKLGRVEHVVSVNNLPLAQLDSGDHDHWMFREPGNILFEQGPHPLAQICALLGPVRDVRTTCSHTQLLRTGRPFATRWQLALTCERGTADWFLAFGASFPDSSIRVLGQDGVAEVDLLNSTYALDRRTKYLDAVDRLRRGRSKARQIDAGARRGFWNYVLSTLKLRGRSDWFYVSLRDSVAAFYRHARGEGDWDSAQNGVWVIEGLERVARNLADAQRLEPAQRPVDTRPSPQTGDVLVIGGTGFIGRGLLRALTAAGHSVRLLARRPGLAPDGAAVVPGDVRNPADVDRAVPGCKAVIHLVAGAPESWPEFQRLFIDGTRHTAEACLNHKVEQLLYVSSIAAYNLADPRATITEETPLDEKPEKRSPYSRVKIECEQLLLRMQRERGLPVTIFRPGVVVGAGGPIEHQGVGWWPAPTHCISWGRATRSPLPFVLADDVIAALTAALGRGDLAGQSFNLVGDVRLSAEEYLDAVRAASDRLIELHRQSLAWWWTVDVFKWLVKAAARKPDNLFPSYRDLASRALRSAFDCRRAKKVLGWRPVAEREEFIERGIRAPLRERGNA